jgi:hypothetical protein
MAKKILSDLSSFLNRYFWRDRFPFEKKQLTAYLLCGRMLRVWTASCPGEGYRISQKWQRKVQQSVSRNLSTCASATCDQDSPDVMRTGEVANLTTQPGKRYDIALRSLQPEGQRLHPRSLLKKYYAIVAQLHVLER